MNKYFKILTTIMVVIALVACLGVFVACNDANNDDTPATDNAGTTTEKEYTYKFTVLDADGNPVEGARVKLCKGEDLCKTPKKTDANGIVKFYADEEMNNVPADVYDIHVILNGTEYDFDFKTSTTEKDYTLNMPA